MTPTNFDSPAIATPKRKASKSPTARALADLRKMGFTAGVVEKWNQFARVRQDLFGCIDIVAMFPGVGVLGVQATSGGGIGKSNHSARRRKAIAEPRLRTWLESGARFEIWSYDKPRGERRTWELRREEITLDDLPAGDRLFAREGGPTP